MWRIIRFSVFCHSYQSHWRSAVKVKGDVRGGARRAGEGSSGSGAVPEVGESAVTPSWRPGFILEKSNLKNFRSKICY